MEDNDYSIVYWGFLMSTSKPPLTESAFGFEIPFIASGLHLSRNTRIHRLSGFPEIAPVRPDAGGAFGVGYTTAR